jgi:nucleotide-binding universal stress UspA family protein
VTGDRGSAQEALQAFSRARRRAALRSLLAALGGREDRLLSFEEVRRRLHAVESPAARLEDVPLDAIVGSVGRYNDFTREFLPRSSSDRERWVGINVAMSGPLGTPPVELYRIGDAYFVKDGNHRVSVARQLGAPTIQAYVTPVRTRVPLSPSTTPDELILAEEHARFLEETGLDEVRSGVDVRLTVPGQYDALREHIAVHRYFMGLDEDREVGEAEAVAHWYDEVYRSVVEAIRASGILRDFPGRTEADLYLWLSNHRGRLADELGFDLPSETIAEHLGNGPRLAAEPREQVLDSARSLRRAGRPGELTLTDDVLVVIDPDETAWTAVDQAVLLGRREAARIYGLHVIADESDRAEAERLGERFARACEAGGVEGQFTVAEGTAAEHVRERLPWFDLAVVPMVGRDEHGARRLRAAYQSLLRRSVRPLLTVAERASGLTRPLVAYDGGSRADQALFVAAYIAMKWDAPLVVTTVADRPRASSAALEQAKTYLERFGVTADYVEARGAVADALVRVASERGCDMLLMGSHRYARWLESMLGGIVERTLLACELPTLVV